MKLVITNHQPTVDKLKVLSTHDISVDFNASDKMSTPIKSVIILTTCLCTTLAINVIIQANVESKDEKSIIINWSQSYRINGSVRYEIFKLLMGKVDFIVVKRTFEILNNWHIHRKPVTVVIIASNKMEIRNNISHIIMIRELMNLRSFHMRMMVIVK